MSKDYTPLFSWIHLSDLHQSHGSISTQIDQEMVQNKLIEDCKQILAENQITNPYCFFSGDIASKGNEYTKAKRFLKNIKETLNIPLENFLLIPGNHDIQREVGNHNSNIRRMLLELRENDVSIDTAIGDESDRALLLARLDNFNALSKEFIDQSKFDPHGIVWSENLDINPNLSISIIGLNSCLLSLDDSDKGKIQIGNYQISKAIETNHYKDYIRIVMFHHPIEWLKDKETVRRWLTSNCSILITGHEHEQKTSCIQPATGKSFLSIEAGSCHTTEIGTTHSYNIATILYERETKNILLRIFPRKWVDEIKDFRIDQSSVPKDKVICELPINLIEKTNGERIPVIIAKNANDLEPFAEPCDFPPETQVWVGRQMESELLTDASMKVIAITGLGGQGKSALAGRFIESNLHHGEWKWDWRDCKEEGDKLQTHILRIVSRFSKNTIDTSALAEETFSSIVELLFSLIESEKIVFVFDNIDHYIDTEAKQPTLGMKVLIDAALSRRHKSRFIFTCRPKIEYDNPSFYNIALEGLSPAESLELFKQRGVAMDEPALKRKLVEIHKLTNGHTLWLNLIATQTAKDRAKLDWLTKDIKKGVDEGLPTPTLRSIWVTLTENQKILLRYMAEMVRPENEEQISSFVREEIGYSKFKRTLGQLKDLSLVVIKSIRSDLKGYELHPVIKTFILKEFSKNERVPFIERIAQFFDSVIALISKKPSTEISFSMIENYIHRAELAINSGDVERALGSIQKASVKLLGEGYQVEFIRIAKKAFEIINVEEAILKEYPYFDSVFSDLIDSLSMQGRIEEINPLLDRYEAAIAGNSARFIHLCNIKCHSFWIQGNLPDAVKWGIKGKRIKDSTGIDTQCDCSYNLALAQRDSGQIDEALLFFLSGQNIESVKKGESGENRNGAFFGNVGRCLYLKGDFQGALDCIVVSARILKMDVTTSGLINRGWAAYWIGDILEKQGNFLDSALFYRHAQFIWAAPFPIKAQSAENRFLSVLEKQLSDKSKINTSLESYEILTLAEEWLERYFEDLKRKGDEI